MNASKVLARSGVTHVVVAATKGFEIIENVRMKFPTRKSTYTSMFQAFCKTTGVRSVATELDDSSIFGHFKYEFADINRNIVIWTQYHPIYEAPRLDGLIGDVALRVEEKSSKSFGQVRSALRLFTNIAATRARTTKDDMYRELSQLLDERLGYKKPEINTPTKG
jgi:hypothetical protein